MRILLLAAFSLVLIGCAGPYAGHNKQKITQGEKVWYSCDVWVGKGYISFKDETGRNIVLQGNALVEETDIPCQER